jgi:hypothetical protein
MDHKALKSDLTYALKKLTKEGMTITFEALADTMRYEDGKLVLTGNQVDVLEALVFIKGYQCPPIEQGFSVPLLDIISEQGQVAKSDLYDFLDGLENVAGNDKTEFYKVGVYIREKFIPVGVRTETLQKAKFVEHSNVASVKKFVVYNRVIPGGCAGSSCTKPGVKGLPSIVEVECEVFKPILSQEGEFVARILKPEFLWEPTRVLQEGVLKDVTLPPVYMSHAVYESLALAREAAERQVKGGFDFEVRKGKIASYTDEELKAKCELIQEVLLS